VGLIAALFFSGPLKKGVFMDPEAHAGAERQKCNSFHGVVIYFLNQTSGYNEQQTTMSSSSNQNTWPIPQGRKPP
jgi:hypothetical protein